jgi:hypothetical protein
MCIIAVFRLKVNLLLIYLPESYFSHFLDAIVAQGRIKVNTRVGLFTLFQKHQLCPDGGEAANATTFYTV